MLTIEEFDAIEEFEEGYRYELIRGVVVVTPPASDAEMDPNGELEFLLRFYKYQHPNGHHLDGTQMEREVRTHVGLRRVDRAIWCGLGRSPDSRVDLPTIIVEFVSPGRRAFTRDYQDKRKEYLELGCQEYWIIDRFRRCLTIYCPDKEPVVIEEKQTYETKLLPGFQLPLARLLKLADLHPDDLI
ncbi:Uma2 family endonuclease [Anatilimnocola floriformis]|uniref:Uma2 family endonuclease n=1 Tax=Anatilimnocola floriformis TaxID=2948575 RepID=UPI0020C24DC0|nr:Uma2 family endonuclease [Anatilimnocola floriformis]